MHLNLFDVTEIKVKNTTQLTGENFIRKFELTTDRGPVTITLFSRDYDTDLELIMDQKSEDIKVGGTE